MRFLIGLGIEAVVGLVILVFIVRSIVRASIGKGLNL